MIIIGRYNKKNQNWFDCRVSKNNIEGFAEFIKWTKQTYMNTNQNDNRYKVVVKKRTLKVYEYGELLVKYKLIES